MSVTKYVNICYFNIGDGTVELYHVEVSNPILFVQLLYKKVDFSCYLGKNIDLIHLLDPIQYEL